MSRLPSIDAGALAAKIDARIAALVSTVALNNNARGGRGDAPPGSSRIVTQP